MWSDARHGANVPLARTAPQPGDARATPPMRVDHLPNKRMPLVPGVIPGRGMACMDLCPHHITRESSWRSGGAHGRGMDEEHTPRAGATMARACRTVLCVACVVWWPVASASPTAGKVWQVAVWRHRPASRDPPVSFVSLSARGVGASARCSRRLWRCDERDERPTDDPRLPASAPREIGSADAGESIQLSYNDNLISAPLLDAKRRPGSQRLNTQWLHSSSSQARLRKGTHGAALGKTRCCNGRGRAGGCRRREVMLVLLLRLLSKRDHVRCCSSGFSARAEQLMQGSELCGLPWPLIR